MIFIEIEETNRQKTWLSVHRNRTKNSSNEWIYAQLHSQEKCKSKWHCNIIHTIPKFWWQPVQLGSPRSRPCDEYFSVGSLFGRWGQETQVGKWGGKGKVLWRVCSEAKPGAQLENRGGQCRTHSRVIPSKNGKLRYLSTNSLTITGWWLLVENELSGVSALSIPQAHAQVKPVSWSQKEALGQSGSWSREDLLAGVGQAGQHLSPHSPSVKLPGHRLSHCWWEQTLLQHLSMAIGSAN